jgi:hypothetical protein
MTIKKSNKNSHKKKCNGTCEVCDCKTEKSIHPIFTVLGIWKRVSIN